MYINTLFIGGKQDGQRLDISAGNNGKLHPRFYIPVDSPSVETGGPPFHGFQRQEYYLHEFYAAEKTYLAYVLTSITNPMEHLLNSYQGVSVPSREVLAGLLSALHYGQWSCNEEAAKLRRNIEEALKDFDIGLHQFRS